MCRAAFVRFLLQWHSTKNLSKQKRSSFHLNIVKTDASQLTWQHRTQISVGDAQTASPSTTLSWTFGPGAVFTSDVPARGHSPALTVIPVQEEEREGAHHQEEEDPHSEASVVFYRLVNEQQQKKNISHNFLLNNKQRSNSKEEFYLPNVFVSFLNVFCCTNNKLMNVVYFTFLSQEEKQEICLRPNVPMSTKELKQEEPRSPAAALSLQRFPEVVKSPPPSPRFAWGRLRSRNSKPV